MRRDSARGNAPRDVADRRLAGTTAAGRARGATAAPRHRRDACMLAVGDAEAFATARRRDCSRRAGTSAREACRGGRGCAGETTLSRWLSARGPHLKSTRDGAMAGHQSHTAAITHTPTMADTLLPLLRHCEARHRTEDIRQTASAGIYASDARACLAIGLPRQARRAAIAGREAVCARAPAACACSVSPCPSPSQGKGCPPPTAPSAAAHRGDARGASAASPHGRRANPRARAGGVAGPGFAASASTAVSDAAAGTTQQTGPGARGALGGPDSA
eukprot:350255-Chlamydomonas_euryale.AAC.21